MSCDLATTKMWIDFLSGAGEMMVMCVVLYFVYRVMFGGRWL